MNSRPRPTPLSRACFAAFMGAGVVVADPAHAQDAEERIRQLEEQLKTLTQELQTLKEQVSKPPPAPAAAPAAAESDAVKKAQVDAAAASAQTAELRDKVQTLEQRADQTPIARLANGFTFEDPRGRWTARLTGRVQGDYRNYSPSDALPDTFGVRRARLGLELAAFKNYVFYVEGEFATGNASGNTAQNASLTNAWLDLNWVPWARPRIGQFKPPIGFENSAPDVLTDFQERALTNNLLQNLNYDRGIMVQGVPYRGVYYGVSLTNGTGLNLEERNASAQDVNADGKDITARLAVNFANWLDWRDSVMHVGVSYKDGTVSNAPTQGSGSTSGFVAATGRTEAFGTTFFTPQAFNGAGGVTAADNIDRRLEVLEAALAWKQFKLQGEYWTANYKGTKRAPAPVVSFDRDIDAYYISAFWMLTGEAYADAFGGNATFGRIRPRNNFGWSKDSGWGAWELGLRYSKFDASDFNNNNPPATGRLGATAPTTVSTNEADAWTAMVKWILNPYTRILVNYVYTDFETPVTTNGVTYSAEKAVTLRAQFDF